MGAVGPSAPASGHLGRTTARGLAQVGLLCAGYDLMLTRLYSAVFLIVVAAVPVAVVVVRRFPAVRWFLGAGLLAIASGWLLRATAAPVPVPDDVIASNQTFKLVTGFSIVVLVLWARTVLPMWRVGVAYGIGSLVAAALTPAAYLQDGYKFYFSGPLTLIVLAVADRFGSRGVAACAALALAVIGIVNDARSYMAFCVLAAALLAWQSFRASGRTRRNRAAPVVLIGGLGISIYLLMSHLLTGGYLGANLQAKSVAQVNAAGSLIAGGRPEWAATLQLMRVHPWGYGVGVHPGTADILAAKGGLVSVGLQVDNNGYVNNYMFGAGLELHSVAADLWAEFGVAGLVLAVVCAVTMVGGLSRALAESRASGLVIYQTTFALWVLAFGPIYSNWPDVCLAVGLVLGERVGRRTAPHRRDAVGVAPAQFRSRADPSPTGAR